MAQDDRPFDENLGASYKRKYDDLSDHVSRTSDRDRKAGFSGEFSAMPPGFERKTGFSRDSDRRTGFSSTPPGVPANYERKPGLSMPPGSGPVAAEHERKTGFSGPPVSELERKTGFSGPHYERKTGFSGPPSGNYLDTNFSTVQTGTKTGFPSGQDRNSEPPDDTNIENARQRAEEIAARLVGQESKRTWATNGGDEPLSLQTHGYSSEGYDLERTYQARSQDHMGSYPNMQGNAQSHRMVIPNPRVGLIIGKGGETIKLLQSQSGARIQITRDADHDPRNPNREVEISGTMDEIKCAEQMIRDTIAEADAGGSDAFGGSFGGQSLYTEQVEMRVPTHKVGLIIGRGGETIRNLQNQSGARIQLVPPQHTRDLGQDERIITLDGTREQIEIASDMVKQVINESRPRGPSGGYNQNHGFRPPGPPQWGAQQGPGQPMQPQGYDNQQNAYRGPPQQYPLRPQSHGGYGQQLPPRSLPPSSPQSYGGYSQPSLVSSQQPVQPTSYKYYSQPMTALPSGSTSYTQTQGQFSQQDLYSQQQAPAPQTSRQPSPAQQTQTQAYGQPVPSQQAYGQPASSGVVHSGYGLPMAPEQGSAQAGYIMQGDAYGHPIYGQKDGSQQVAVSDPATGFSQQDSVQSGYGCTESQGPMQQQPASYAHQAGYGQVQGYGQQEAISVTTQAGYGQVQGYGQLPAQGTPYTQRGSMPAQLGVPVNAVQAIGGQTVSYGKEGSVSVYSHHGVPGGYATYYDQQGHQVQHPSASLGSGGGGANSAAGSQQTTG